MSAEITSSTQYPRKGQAIPNYRLVVYLEASTFPNRSIVFYEHLERGSGI